MKPTEFIVENSIIAQEADDMHRDHEVQMARSQLYSAAQAAIQIHKLLKDVSEMEGLEGWVQTKIAVASEYLESVQDYLKYEAVSQEQEMMAFSEGAANYALDVMINEDFSDKDIDAAVSDYVRSGGEVKKGKPSKGPRRSGLSLASKHIGGGGDKMKPSRTGLGSNPKGKAVVATEQSPAVPAAPTGHGQFTTKTLPSGQTVGFDPATGSQTHSGAQGTTTRDVTGKPTSYRSPSLDGTGTETNLATGEKTTNIRTGDMKVQSTTTPDNRTITRTEVPVGQYTVRRDAGAMFGGAQGGENAIYTVTDTGKEDQYLRQKWGGTDIDPRGKQVNPSQQSELNKLPAHTHSFAGKDPTKGIASVVNEKSKKLKETASAGGSSAGGIATSMGGPGYKQTSGVPKKLGNSHKSKKVTVGKGIY